MVSDKSKIIAGHLITSVIITGQVGVAGFNRRNVISDTDKMPQIVSTYSVGNIHATSNLTDYLGDVVVAKSLASSSSFNRDSSEELWKDIDSLFGAWSELEDVDQWMTELRDRNDKRLKDIYGDEW